MSLSVIVLVGVVVGDGPDVNHHGDWMMLLFLVVNFGKTRLLSENERVASMPNQQLVLFLCPNNCPNVCRPAELIFNSVLANKTKFCLRRPLVSPQFFFCFQCDVTN